MFCITAWGAGQRAVHVQTSAAANEHHPPSYEQRAKPARNQLIERNFSRDKGDGCRHPQNFPKTNWGREAEENFAETDY